MRRNWHSISIEMVFRELGSSLSGLPEDSIPNRLAQFGYNQIEEKKKDPLYVQYLEGFKSLPIILLLAAAAISLLLGLAYDPKKLIDAGAIAVAVLIATTFQFWQEFKAERALEALKKMVVLRSVVVRGGKEASVDSRQLVPGDLVILEEGSRVPADIRLVEAVNLACDQSMLTGESSPSEKCACVLPEKTALADRKNMVFAGTIVVRGHCKGVVVETGMRTEFGKIAKMVSEEEEPETRLQKDIASLSKSLGLIGIALAALFFFIGIMRGESVFDMFVVAVTLAVAVIPEGLPTVLAITLAIGVQMMAKQNAIVRKISAVEALGSTAVICTDKTGTLTQNRMTVQELVLPHKVYAASQSMRLCMQKNDPCLSRAIEVMTLCNNAISINEDGKEVLSGDPTETALLFAVKKCGIDEHELRLKHKEVAEIPFDASRKMMTSVRVFGSKRLALVKGAPEKVLGACSKILTPDGEKKLSSAARKKIYADFRAHALLGMRILALAYKQVPAYGKYNQQNAERGLVYVGFASMEDPPRPDVAEAISLCKTAGIRVIMITGDSLPTARAIAAKIGLLENMDAVDASKIASVPDSKLLGIIKKTAVFARATPQQKYRIVSLLKKSGEVVAVTGDGVNDAPAIKKADIGIAMGISGTDVSKEVAEIVLADDNFYSIVNAIRLGRATFNNIKSFVRYQISTNVAALSLMFCAPLLSLPLPFNPIQILWINIMIDGPPALALGMEKPGKNIMSQPPRSPKESFVTKNLVFAIVEGGLLMAAISLLAFAFFLSYEPQKASTAVFTLFVFLQLFNALNCRSGTESIFSRLFSNPAIYAAIAISLLIHFSIVYLDPLQEIFRTVELGPEDFIIIASCAAMIIVFEEAKKKFFASAAIY